MSRGREVHVGTRKQARMKRRTVALQGHQHSTRRQTNRPDNTHGYKEYYIMLKKKVRLIDQNLTKAFSWPKESAPKKGKNKNSFKYPRQPQPATPRSHLLDGPGGEQRTHAQAERLQHTAPLPDGPQAGVRKAGAVGDVQVAQPPATRLQSLSKSRGKGCKICTR